MRRRERSNTTRYRPRPAPPLRYSLAMALAVPLTAALLLSPVGLATMLGLSILTVAAVGA